MISSEAEHPNCMYMWMNYIIDPKVNAQVAEWFGEAPAQELACEYTENPDYCAEYDAEEPEYLGTPLLLEDPARRLRRRPRRMQGLQRLGPGLDRDEGLSSRAVTDGD